MATKWLLIGTLWRRGTTGDTMTSVEKFKSLDDLMQKLRDRPMRDWVEWPKAYKVSEACDTQLELIDEKKA